MVDLKTLHIKVQLTTHIYVNYIDIHHKHGVEIFSSMSHLNN